MSSGKPKEIAEKMVQGRLQKFYQEVVLNEQTSVIDGETKIKDTKNLIIVVSIVVILLMLFSVIVYIRYKESVKG